MLLRISHLSAFLLVGCGNPPTTSDGCSAANLYSECAEGFEDAAETAQRAATLAFSVSAALSFDFAVDLHPESDGKSWPAPERLQALGYTRIHGETWCHEVPRRIDVASKDWSWLHARNVLCHERGHALLGCRWSDHDVMRYAALDARCNEENQRALYGG